MMKKRYLALLLAAVMSLTCMAGCAAVAEEPIVLRYWSGIPEEKGPAQAMAAYTALHPNVTFEFTKIGWDDASNTQVETALMSGVGIDVLTPTRGYVEKAKNGLVLDLTGYLEAAGLDLEAECGEGVLDMKVDGKYFMIPTSTLPVIWLLNKNMFDAAGVAIPSNDWTISEMKEIAQKLTVGDVRGLYCTHNWPMWWVETMGDGCVDPCAIVNADKTAGQLDQPVFTKILADVIDMQNAGTLIPYAECLSESYTPSSVLLSEKAAIVACSTYVLRDIKDTVTYPHDFITAFAGSPKADGAQEQYNRWPLEDPVMVSAKTEHPEEAAEFALWLFTEGTQYFVPFGRMPAHNRYSVESITNMFFDEASAAMFDMDSFKAWYNNDKSIKTTAPTGVDEVIELMGQEAERALVNEITAEEALQNAQKKVNELLAR